MHRAPGPKLDNVPANLARHRICARSWQTTTMIKRWCRSVTKPTMPSIFQCPRKKQPSTTRETHLAIIDTEELHRLKPINYAESFPGFLALHSTRCIATSEPAGDGLSWLPPNTAHLCAASQPWSGFSQKPKPWFFLSLPIPDRVLPCNCSFSCPPCALLRPAICRRTSA